MKRLNDDGLTAVELLITLIIASVVFIAFATTFSGIQNINKKGTDVQLASQAAFAKLEQYENKNYASLPTTSPTNTLQQVEDFSSSLSPVLESPRQGLVYVNTKSNTLKEVIVQVTYDSGGSQGFLQYATMIQKNGVGR